jgi:hypothetical protein
MKVSNPKQRNYNYNINGSEVEPFFPSQDEKIAPNDLITIHTKPEIRKGSIWDIQLKVASKLVTDLDLKKVFVVSGSNGKKKSLNKNDLMVELTVRSKLIKPVKIIPFSKVGVVINEADPLDVVGGIATIKVKFTARPRTVFHKHADMMILVVTLIQGNQTITTTDHELIFRGGTGSNHSADNKKKALLSKNDTKMNDGSSVENSQPSYDQLSQNCYQNIEQNQDFQRMNDPMIMMNNMVMNYFQNMNAVNPSMVPRSNQGVTEYENFDANDFWEDFYINKGERLIPFDNSEAPMQESNQTWQGQEQAEPVLSDNMNNLNVQQDKQIPQDFSISVSGVRNNQNGYEATLQGKFFGKSFQGTININIDQNVFGGQLSGTFSS